MKKEALIALGLTEEQVNKVIEGYGQMVPKARLDEKISQVNAMTEQVKDYDIQLEALKKVDAAALESKIEELQSANTQAQADFAKQLQDTLLRSEMSMALHGKVHDADLVMGLIDREALTLTDGKITSGLTEQLKTLGESKPFLFVPETQTAPPEKQKTTTGFVPHKTESSTFSEPLSVGAQFAQTANGIQAPAGNVPWGQ